MVDDAGAIRVLMVEKADPRDGLAAWLRQSLAFQVDAAADAGEAIDLVRKATGHYDTALVDWRLGGENGGLDAMKRLQAEDADLDVIMMVKRGRVSDGAKAIKAGACNYVAKPVNRDELLVYIERAAARRRAQATHAETAYEREWLHAMLDTSNAFQSSLHVDQVLQIIINGICRLGYDRARLYLKENDVLVGKVQTGGPLTRFDEFRIDIDRDLYTRTTLDSKTPVLYRHDELGPDENELLLGKEDLDEWAELPLLAQGQAVGKITVDNKYSKRRIRAAELELLMHFANQAAIAIENARLHEEAERRNQQQAALDQIALDIANRIERKPLLHAIVERATELVRGTGGGVYLFDEGNAKFIIEAVCGLPASLEGKELAEAGVMGRVAQTRKPIRVKDYRNWPERQPFYDGFNFTAVVAAPIMSSDRFLGVLAVHDTKEGRAFEEADADMLDRFGKHVAAALEKSRAYDAERKAKDYLDKVINSSFDGLIAVDNDGYVTSFNPGAERVLGYRAEQVIGTKMRIDELYGSLERARLINRKLFQQGKLRNFDCTVRSKDGTEIPLKLSAAQLHDGQGHVIGSVGYFQDQRLLKQAKAELKLLVDAVNTVARAQTVDEGLHALAERLVAGTPATFSCILLLDDAGQKLTIKSAYPMPEEGGSALVWNPRVAREITVPRMRSILDEMDTRVFRRGELFEGIDVVEHIRQALELQGTLDAALVIPLKVGSKTFGVCVLGEIRASEESSFDDKNVELAASMAIQAGVLIARIRLHEQAEKDLATLQRLYEAGSMIGSSMNPDRTMRAIVEKACQAVGGWRASAFLIDENGESHRLAAVGYDRPVKETEIGRPSGISAQVVKTGVKYVNGDVRAQPRGMKQSQIDEGVGASICLPLHIGERNIGVLWIHFKEPRQFLESEVEALRMYSIHAAIAYDSAQKIDELNHMQEAIKVAAKMTVLGDRPAALQSITDGTKDAIGCDAVVLFVYDERKGELEHPPTMTGVKSPERASGSGMVRKPSLVYAMMERDKPYVVEASEKDPLFCDRPFTLHEGIKSCMAIPLRAVGKKVGVMFVNYHTPHHFTANERANIQLQADLAAVAISNAQSFEHTHQLVERTQKMLATQNALYDSAQAVTRSVELKEILNQIVEQAYKLTSPQSDSAGYCSIALLRGNVLDFVAAYPFNIADRKLPSIDLATAVPIGITGRAVRTREPQLVLDVSLDTDYMKVDPSICSELAVPIWMEGEIIGVIDVEYPRLSVPSQEDLIALRGLADLAAIAIQNAERVEELGRSNAVAMLGAWGADLVHYMNGEVGKIRRSVFLVQKQQGLPDEVKERLADIDRHAENLGMVELPEQPQEPRLPLDAREAPALDEAIRTEIESFRASSDQLNFEFVPGCRDARVAMHDQYLRRVLRLLIYNAIRAISPDKAKRVVTVRTEMTGPMARVFVEDTGDGIPLEIEPLLFRQPIPHSEGRPGRGLLLVRFLVEQYGGYAGLDRNRPGEGASLVFGVPLALPSSRQGSSSNG